MPQKHTQEEIINFLQQIKPNYDFSNFVFKTVDTPSIVICNLGHTYRTSFSKLKIGRNCPICSKKIAAQKKTLSQDKVITNLKNIFPKYDFSKFNYIKAIIPSTVICDKGHSWSASYNNLMHKKGCPYCKGVKLKKQTEVINELQLLIPTYNFSEFIYKNSKTPGKVICNKGHIWFATYESLKQGHKCKQCANSKLSEMKSYSPETAINKLQKTKPDFDFSNFIYINSTTPGMIKCPKGHIWFASFASIVNKKSGCPECAGVKKLTQKQAITKMSIKRPEYDFNNFIYKNTQYPSTVICDKGHSWNISYLNIMHGYGCPKCAGRNKSQEEVRTNLKKQHPLYDFSKFIYKKAIIPSFVTCDKGHTWEASYDSLMAGKGCPKCSGKNRTQTEAINNLLLKHPEYDFSEFIYLNATLPSKVKCAKGHIFYTYYANLMSGYGCPFCNFSKGEYRIKKWLKKNNISFEIQKTFPNAIYKGLLRWDFFLPEKNILIEYNGAQHYIFVPHFHKSLLEFRIQLERDIIKSKYAEANDYKQFTISYLQYDEIENILDSFLSN